MPEIAVNWKTNDTCIAAMTRYSRELGGHETRIGNIRASLMFSIRSEGDIKAGLAEAISQTEYYSQKLSELQNVLAQAMDAYKQCENGLTGSADKNSSAWSMLFKVMGEFGIAGSVAGLIGSGTSGDLVAVGKGVMKLIGKGAKLADSGTEISWASILGLTAKNDVTGLSEAFEKEISKFAWDSSKSSASNIGVVAKWGGVALTALGAFVENADEFDGDLSNARLWKETVAETAFDTARSVLVGTVVAGLAGATAPAWAVGVVAVGGIALTDYIAKECFGVDIKEEVSDFAVDAADYVTEKADAFFDTVSDAFGDGVKSLGCNISTAWGSLF